jgi:hypothetical protein
MKKGMICSSKEVKEVFIGIKATVNTRYVASSNRYNHRGGYQGGEFALWLEIE